MIREITNVEDITTLEGYKAIEQETNINWLRNDKKISLSTTDNTVVTKFKKLMLKFPNSYKCYELSTNGRIDSYKFVFDYKCLSFRNGKIAKPMSEENKKKFADRMKSIRDSQKQ